MHYLVDIFNEHSTFAIAISLVVSILIAVAGVIPSVFITAANIVFFGFWPGVAVSLAGEALGAIVSFLIYRKGFKSKLQNKLSAYPRARALVNAAPQKAFTGVILLRLLPFVPSGIITLAAAISEMTALQFFIASTLGKIPAILLEGFSVRELMIFGWEGKLIFTFIIIALLYFLFQKSAGKLKEKGR